MRNKLSLLFLAACQMPVAARSTTASTTTSTGTGTGTGATQVFHLAMGEDPSSDPATCDTTDDQCLPAECVFAIDDDAPDTAYVAWPTDDGPWAFVRQDVIRGHPRTLATAPATRDNVHAGATVLVLGMGDQAPYSEAAIVEGTWSVHQVAGVDGDTVHFDGGGDASLVATRVVR